MKTPAVTMDHIEGFAALSPLEKERLILWEIADKAPTPLRFGERLAGGARLETMILLGAGTSMVTPFFSSMMTW